MCGLAREVHGPCARSAEDAPAVGDHKALVCGAQQNLGAALRAAYFLGAAGVLCCDRHSAPLSPAVSKVRSRRERRHLTMLFTPCWFSDMPCWL